MDSPAPTTPNRWTEDTSRRFLDLGRYFVPEREHQMHMIAALIPARDRPFHVLELCCGEGLLAQVVLGTYPAAVVHGLDGSQEMLEQARQRLARFGDRFQTDLFDLAAKTWRKAAEPVTAVVSSLAIHHLTGPEKQELFRDVFGMLESGGMFVIADVVEPSGEAATRLAAEEWDEAVRERARQLDGNDAAFAFFEREQWNMYRYRDPDDIDQPSSLLDQLKWLENAGFADVNPHWLLAGHAIFSGSKP
jgi:tRNA (cmo5U34)-methyltransferase